MLNYAGKANLAIDTTMFFTYLFNGETRKATVILVGLVFGEAVVKNAEKSGIFTKEGAQVIGLVAGEGYSYFAKKDYQNPELKTLSDMYREPENE